MSTTWLYSEKRSRASGTEEHYISVYEYEDKQLKLVWEMIRSKPFAVKVDSGLYTLKHGESMGL